MSYGEPMDVQEIRPLELLHRTAEYLGAVVCLMSTADKRDGDRRTVTREEGAKLRSLVIVKPAPTDRYPSRWERLARGSVIAWCEVVDAVPLDTVAHVVVEELQARIAEAARRNAA